MQFTVKMRLQAVAAIALLISTYPLRAGRKPKPMRLLTPHPVGQQQVLREDSGFEKGIVEIRGSVMAAVVYVVLSDYTHAGHQDAKLFLAVKNKGEQELPVRQDYFFSYDGENGRILPMFDEDIERASILGEAPPRAYQPLPPPPSYTVTYPDGSRGTVTPQSDGIREAGDAIAAGIQSRGFQKQRDAALKDLETHFHDALLQPEKAMEGWIIVHQVPSQHPLRIVMYVGRERFVFMFGADYQKYQPEEEKQKKQ